MFNDDIPQWAKENLGCTLIATFGTESTKSAILTACRGYRSEDYPDGIEVDDAQYMSSLIPQERGFLWSIKDVIYGNEEKGRKPITSFINEVNKYPGLLDIIIAIDGVKNKRSSHASGVILFDNDPFEYCSFMKTPKGEIIAAFDLHDLEYLGNTKYDFLVTEVQDKLVQTIQLLQKDGQIEPDLSLREVYNKYFHPNVLPKDDERIWNALANDEVINVFQFDSLVGRQAAKLIKPKNVSELSDANGLMRLMAQDGEEQPLEKYVRFKNDISLWYKEMTDFGLTKEEQKYLEPYFKSSYGVPPSQEQLMLMLMDKNICGFSLSEANTARKIVGKKQMEKIPELREKVLKQASSRRLGEYVWKHGAGPQMGYSFSLIHSLAYSFIGAQTLYIATNWDPIYWNTGCLIVNSGSLQDNSTTEIVDIYEPEHQEFSEGTTFEDLPDRSGKIKRTSSTDYSKTAKALGEIINAGIKVSLVDINNSDFGFKPDVKNNQILFGMKALLNVSDDLVFKIIENRPYISPKDFINKVKPNKQAMISLIKGGAFDNMMDRTKCMIWYIWETCDKKKVINLRNMGGLIKNNLLPERTKEEIDARRIYEFNRYLKSLCKNKDDDVYYHLNDRAIEFLNEMEYDYLFDIDNTNKIKIKIKDWTKIYQSWMDVFRKWISDNHDDILNQLNFLTFKNDWDKYAKGNLSSWEMEALCFYYHEHELEHINKNRYNFVDFFSLPEYPIIENSFEKGGKTINLYKLNKISGTCIAKDKNKSSVSLLTTTGVVNVKFRKEYFALFDKQISEKQPDGTKKVIEKSWFNRGNMIIVQGIRQGDNFIAKKYSSTPGHTLYHILEITKDGEIITQSERYKGGAV